MALFQTQTQTEMFLAYSPLLSWARSLQPGLTVAEKQGIASQLLILIKDYYVHLPLKTSSLAIDPVQEFALLLDDTPLIQTDVEFFHRLINIVKKLRDRHTSFKLPAPWSNMIAYLPFVVELGWEADRRRLLVTKLMAGLGDPHFKVGVEITHWNGVPISRYIERLSWETEGANPFARIALALRSLTVRPLTYMLPPDEDWVSLTYESKESYRTISIPWRVYFPVNDNDGSRTIKEQYGEVAIAQGIDRPTSLLNRSWLEFYTDDQGEDWDPQIFPESDPLRNVPNPLSTNLLFRTTESIFGRYGYIRIFSFETDDTPKFLRDFADILRMMPRAGIIIDVRSNPGGTIPAGEGLLQLFTNKNVSSEKLSFRITPSIQRIGNAISYFQSWKRSLNLRFETGQIFSQGFSLLNGNETDGLAGVYKYPVVVIIDALSYSTTDFFAAGIQDNGIGKIIGTDPTTGAGGANVWTHRQLLQFSTNSGGTDLAPMPRDSDMNIAIRRSERVGPNDSLPLEGLGVTADYFYKLTLRDIMGKNADLVTYASYILSRM